MTRDDARVARGSALLFSSRVVGNAGFFIAVLLLARSLSIPDRGQFAFVTTAAFVTSRITGVGVADATTIFAARQTRSRGALLTNGVFFAALSSLTGAVVFCGALFLFEVRPAGVTDAELLLMAVGAVLTSLGGAANHFLIGCARWRVQAVVSALMPWLYAFLLAIASAESALTVNRALLIWIAVYGIWGVCFYVAAVRETPLRLPNLRLLADTIGFGVRAWTGSVAVLLNYRLDQLIMAFLAPPSTLGVYAVAVNASEPLLILPDAAATALTPTLARSDPSSRADQALRAFRVLFLICAAAVCIGAVLGSVLIPVVFGAGYQAAVTPFLWLAVGSIGFVASAVFSTALLASSSPGRASIAPVVSLIVGTGLDFVLIPPLGATGAAIAATVAFVSAGISAILVFQKQTKFAYRTLVPRRDDCYALRRAVNDLLVKRRFDSESDSAT